MPLKEKEIEKIHYSGREVAEILGVSDSNVRYWENEFSTIKPYRNKRGVRYYSKADIEEFKLIHYLIKQKGYTLSGAKRKLQGNRDEVVQKQQIVERLTSVKHILEEIKKELD